MPTNQPEYLVHKFLKPQLTYLLLARPHRFKSWLVDDLAVSVASNTFAFGQFPVYQARVILIDEDTPTPTLRNRLTRFCRHRNIDLNSIQLDYRSMQGFQLDGASVGTLEQEIQAIGGPVLVILDCLTSMVGTWDMDRTAQANRAVQVWNRLKAAGATLIVVHHISIHGREDHEIFDGRDFTRFSMGNTRLVSGCDIGFGLWEMDKADPKTVVVVKKERREIIDVPDAFSLQLIEDPARSWVYLQYLDEVPEMPSDNARLIYALFAAQPTAVFTVKEVRNETGQILSDRHLREALKELQANDVVELERRNVHNIYKYRLNPNFATLTTSYAEELRK